MQMTGEYRINADREAVWAALNDPEVLKACIPGCQELEQTSDGGFAAKVKAKVGPVSATFKGAVTLSDINPPESYTISGEGKGGAAGFAKGGAKVKLSEDGEATLLAYEVDAQVGGKLAQIGSRLIDGTAKKMAEQFFGSFAEQVGGPAPEEAAEEAAAPSAEEQAEMATAATQAASLGHAAPSDAGSEDLDKDVGAGVGPGVWVAGLILVVLVLLLIFGLG